MMASVETRRDTGFLLSAGTGSEACGRWVMAQPIKSGLNGAVGPVHGGGSHAFNLTAAIGDPSTRGGGGAGCRACDGRPALFKPPLRRFGANASPWLGRDNSSTCARRK